MPNEREALAPGSGSALEPEPGDISIQLMPLSYGTLILVSDPATERYAVAPAPGSLQRVQSFLNTRGTGLPAEPDLLVSAASVIRGQSGHGGQPGRAGPLRELREALQAQLEAGRDAPQAAHQPDLAHHLEQLRWTMTLEEGQLTLRAEGPGWRQVAGTLLSDILTAQQHELWPRLKACRNPLCSVVFYDNSKNQARVWHNTSVCGNLINLRASRARRREQAS
jgi:predicted RNA-binding Zn ribbon-like protein